MRRIIVTLETDSTNSIDEIKDDLIMEISSCWNSLEAVKVEEERSTESEYFYRKGYEDGKDAGYTEGLKEGRRR
jgi:flagellar biosynthesis/type III secretory pathway protein FliH